MEKILFIINRMTDIVAEDEYCPSDNLKILLPDSGSYKNVLQAECYVAVLEGSKKEGIYILAVGTGKVEWEPRAKQYQLNMTFSGRITNTLVIENFIAVAEVGADVEREGLLHTERAENLIAILENYLYAPHTVSRKRDQRNAYPVLKTEGILSPFSQKNEYCQRATSFFNPQDKRGEFQRDYERIIHSSAYRKLVDKAQIFTASKGEQYRTRMTHTMEVNQIARAISASLGLNLQLTEAIALGHDLGHTPFGHQGERTLDDILKNKIKVIPGSFCHNPFGGFKHNFQGLRVVQFLEERYAEFEGIDLSYQVLEGIFKHTKGKIKSCERCSQAVDCPGNCYSLEEMIEPEDIPFLYPQYSFPTTLEGQVVALSDEIAQRSHDLDDAFAAGAITPGELLQKLQLQKAYDLQKEFEKIRRNIQDSKDMHRFFVDEEKLYRGRVVSTVIHYFIEDVVKQSEKNLNNYDEEKHRLFVEDHRFDACLIAMSDSGAMMADYLERIIARKVINGLETVQFDHKAAMVIEGLFRAYYKKPLLLPPNILRRIFAEMRKHTINVIDFNTGDLSCTRRELERITNMELPSDPGERTSEEEEYWQKRKILVRGITDWISGMTDSYALKEYRLLYEA